MKSSKILVSLVATFALLVLSLGLTSALADITTVEVSDETVYGSGAVELAITAGDTIPVDVKFAANENASDVRVKAWVSGGSDSAVTSRFHVLDGRTYTRTLNLKVPANIDPTEDLTLNVVVESDNSGSSEVLSIPLTVTRESYKVEIMSVISDTKVTAGDNLALDIVLKNRGFESLDDTYVAVRIPALGIEDGAYFGDLSSMDTSHPDKEDASERRVYLQVPKNTPAGVYTLEVEAFNEDSSSVVSRKIAVVGASEDSMVVSASHSKTFNAGETEEYSLTIVNSGNKVRVYELVFETASGLTLEASDPILAIPAGTSKTVKIMASANKPGKYDFAVNVHSGSELVKSESFTANVEGKGLTSGKTNTTVLLTVVLAIVFVVLLVVLIVLLTRKPQKTEEFGESYY